MQKKNGLSCNPKGANRKEKKQRFKAMVAPHICFVLFVCR